MKPNMLSRFLCPVLAASVLACAAAGEYPSKTIQFIVNREPGGGSDTVTRMYAACLEKTLGCTTVVINRPGGDTVVGTNLVAKAAPDGYTLAVSGPGDICHGIVNGVGVQFTVDSFAYIANLVLRGSVLAARQGAPFASFEEFVAYARANPKK